jgi:glycosyltransferase involved in cell wall biosynthesis
MTPKHICIFPDRLDNGGVGRYAINLAEALIAQGAKVDLFVTAATGELFSQRPTQARLFVGGGSSKKSVVPFYRYLRQERPELLITANAYIDIMGVVTRSLARVATQQAITIHTARSADDMAGKVRLKQVYDGLCRWFYPQAKHIIAVSEAVARDSKDYFRLPNVKVIYNPVVTPSLYSKSTGNPQHPFFYNKTAPVLLAIGRLTTQKDFGTLLRAFAEIRKRQTAKLLILGEGEDRPMLETLAHDLNITQDLSMPGFVDNPYPYIKQSDVLISSSAWEGLPTVLIEALALGTPVVATDCPGGSNEILQGGVYGPLVSMKNPTALAQAVINTLASPPDPTKLKERGQGFSMEASATHYLELLGAT